MTKKKSESQDANPKAWTKTEAKPKKVPDPMDQPTRTSLYALIRRLHSASYNNPVQREANKANREYADLHAKLLDVPELKALEDKKDDLYTRSREERRKFEDRIDAFEAKLLAEGVSEAVKKMAQELAAELLPTTTSATHDDQGTHD